MTAGRPDQLLNQAALQQLRKALIDFCRWNGSSQPEDVAHQTIVILLSKEHPDEIRDLIRYAKGVAKNLIREEFQDRAREAGACREPSCVDEQDEHLGDRLSRLEHCLRKQCTPDERRLLMSYFCGKGAEQIQRRSQLAAERSLTAKGLRSRIHRLIERLRCCLQNGCKGEKET